MAVRALLGKAGVRTLRHNRAPGQLARRHYIRAFFTNLLSVPLSKRRIFSRWRTITNSPSAVATRFKGHGFLNNQLATGTARAASTDPSETYRVTKKVRIH